MAAKYQSDIEDAFRNAIREANYLFRVTYKDMAENSGYKESTLKAFVNQEKHLPDERETLSCMVRLSKWLSEEHDCNSVARVFLPHNKHVQENGKATVDGDLSNEIRGILEENGSLSTADKTNNIKELKRAAKELGKIVSNVYAEIALKERGQ